MLKNLVFQGVQLVQLNLIKSLSYSIIIIINSIVVIRKRKCLVVQGLKFYFFTQLMDIERRKICCSGTKVLFFHTAYGYRKKKNLVVQGLKFYIFTQLMDMERRKIWLFRD